MAEAGATAADGFKAAYASGADWSATATACVEALGEVPAGANLGFLYATDPLAGHTESLVKLLRRTTGIEHWVGTTGFGVAGSGVEIYDQPAISLLVGRFPESSFQVFQPVTQNLEDFHRSCDGWLSRNPPLFGVVHGDPRNPLLPHLIDDLSGETSAFLVGGLSASRNGIVQLADRVSEGGLSGVLFSAGLEVAAGLSQGCQPIGPSRRITAAERNIVIAIDGQPALDVLLDDLGVETAADLSPTDANTMVAFPVAGSDTGDYMVRNLMGIDAEQGLLAVGEIVESGQNILFCRRDQAAARADLKRMLDQVKRRLEGPPRAALYFSCIARGVNLFGPDAAEMRLIRDELGDLPLAGFYANGEISNNRLYGYTGVLALFL